MFTLKNLHKSTKRFFALVIVVLFETVTQQILKQGMEERVRDTRGEKILAIRLNQLLQP